MEDRIREILKQQMAMQGQGGYGTHMGAIKASRTRKRRIMNELGGIGPSKRSKRAAARSPWINFLKEIEMNYGIPYNEAMIDPKIRQMYHEQYGSGTLVGGKSNCWTKFRHDYAPLPKSKVKVRSAYKKFLEKGLCIPNTSKYQNYIDKGDIEDVISATVIKKKVTPKRKPKKSNLSKLSKGELIKALNNCYDVFYKGKNL
jgi:hypothetical protein